MPVTDSNVGNLALPIPAGALNAALTDPTCIGLLDYLGFWLKNNLDAKLAQMQGTGADACPTANRFPWDPAGYFVRQSVPALYVWWDGRSTRREQTMLLEQRDRTINAVYVFEELAGPTGLTARAGLMAAVDAIFAKASERGRHPSYGYGSDADGTPIWKSLNLIHLGYIGGEVGAMAPVPSGGATPGGPGDGAVIRFYPSLRAQFSVSESIDQDTLQDPTDVLRDLPFQIETNETGDPTDTVPYMTRYLVGPDGAPLDPEVE